MKAQNHEDSSRSASSSHFSPAFPLPLWPEKKEIPEWLRAGSAAPLGRRLVRVEIP